MTATVLDILCSYGATQTVTPLPPAVSHHARRALIDWFAALYPGTRVKPATLLVAAHRDELGVGKCSLPGFGTKVAWTPHDRLLLNWRTYIGSEFPDDQRRMRYFNNLYAHMVLSSAVSMYLGFDIGWQHKAESA